MTYRGSSHKKQNMKHTKISDRTFHIENLQLKHTRQNIQEEFETQVPFVQKMQFYSSLSQLRTDIGLSENGDRCPTFNFALILLVYLYSSHWLKAMVYFLMCTIHSMYLFIFKNWKCHGKKFYSTCHINEK